MNFHTEYDSQHGDWICRCGIAVGCGSTPKMATINCLKDIACGYYADAIGWLGTPDKPKAPVHVEHMNGIETWLKGWRAEFTDEFYQNSYWGYGKTPDEAVQSLMDAATRLSIVEFPD